MSEPHQRTRSGKLRQASRRAPPQVDTQSRRQSTALPQGIRAHNQIEADDIDDTVDTHQQTPTHLTRQRIAILNKVMAGYTGKEDVAVDPTWRNSWCIGVWHVGSSVTVSINILQPNVAGCWVTISKCSQQIISARAEAYNSIGLRSSTCRATYSRGNVQVQGRWSLNLADDLIDEGLIDESNVEIAGLNICQSSIYLWVLVGPDSKYLCSLTMGSLGIITRYIPDNCSDIEEVSACGSISLKIKGTTNDATQLSVTSTGAVQYQGGTRYLTELPRALSTALGRTMESVHREPFLSSLHYTKYAGF